MLSSPYPSLYLRDSQQDAITYEASETIEYHVQKISEQIQPGTSYKTKHNAMCALRNIGFVVIEGNDFLRWKVRNHMAFSSVFVDAMQSLYDSMTESERTRISHDYLGNLERLDKKRDVCYEGFDKIVELLRKSNPRTQDEGAKGAEVTGIDLTV